MSRKRPLYEGEFGREKPRKNEPRAKHCLKWLLVLYCGGGGRNGWGGLRWFETQDLSPDST